jgi:hypothetical protein
MRSNFCAILFGTGLIFSCDRRPTEAEEQEYFTKTALTAKDYSTRANAVLEIKDQTILKQIAVLPGFLGVGA